VSRINDTQIAFSVHNVPGAFPQVLIDLRAMARKDGAFIPAAVVRDALTCVLMELRQAVADEAAVAKKTVVPVAPSQDTVYEEAWTLVTQALGAVRLAANNGWVELDVALEIFRPLSYLETIVDLPAEYEAAVASLGLAKTRNCDAGLSVLESGLLALMTAVMVKERTS